MCVYVFIKLCLIILSYNIIVIMGWVELCDSTPLHVLHRQSLGIEVGLHGCLLGVDGLGDSTPSLNEYNPAGAATVGPSITATIGE